MAKLAYDVGSVAYGYFSPPVAIDNMGETIGFRSSLSPSLRHSVRRLYVWCWREHDLRMRIVIPRPQLYLLPLWSIRWLGITTESRMFVRPGFPQAWILTTFLGNSLAAAIFGRQQFRRSEEGGELRTNSRVNCGAQSSIRRYASLLPFRAVFMTQAARTGVEANCRVAGRIPRHQGAVLRQSHPSVTHAASFRRPYS